MHTTEELLLDTIVNGVTIHVVKGRDEDGDEYVRILAAAGGDLEGEMPGEYYPVPHGA